MRFVLIPKHKTASAAAETLGPAHHPSRLALLHHTRLRRLEASIRQSPCPWVINGRIVTANEGQNSNAIAPGATMPSGIDGGGALEHLKSRYDLFIPMSLRLLRISGI